MDRGQNMGTIKERKEAKLKMESARSESLKHRRRQEYNAKNNEVKQSAREDKRNWMEGKAAAAEKATENGRNKELYNKTTSRGMEETRSRHEDKQGVIKTEVQERLQRWMEHFSEILNRDVPMNPVEEDGGEELEETEEIDLRSWQILEVKNALNMTK